MLVHYTPPGQREPWVTILTKRPSSLDIVLNGPKNLVGFGRVTELAWDRELDDTRPERDLIWLKFRTLADLRKGDLEAFLQDHLTGCAHAE